MQETGACDLHPQGPCPVSDDPGTSPGKGSGPLRAWGPVQDKEWLADPRLAPGQPVLDPRSWDALLTLMPSNCPKVGSLRGPGRGLMCTSLGEMKAAQPEHGRLCSLLYFCSRAGGCPRCPALSSSQHGAAYTSVWNGQPRSPDGELHTSNQ